MKKDMVKYMFVVALINKKGEILLAKGANIHNRNLWGVSLSGDISKDENSEKTVKRKLKEVFDIESKLIFVQKKLIKEKTGKVTYFLYYIETNESEVKGVNERKVIWIDPKMVGNFERVEGERLDKVSYYLVNEIYSKVLSK